MDGILNINKVRGFTSHDVVAKLRGICKIKRIGHTGTLDPDAEGVLPVCLGRATKLCGRMTDKEKEYRAVMRLGVETDTQDMTGNVLERRPVEVSEDEVSDAILSFAGEYDQIPPMYSAIKMNGKHLYELARAGETVQREPRRVTLSSIRIEDISMPEVTMTVACSKGTYIRTLCHDIGQRLGCGAAMKQLIRTRSGQFRLEDSVRLEQVEQYVREGRLQELLISPDRLFLSAPRLTAMPEGEKLLYNGNPMPASLLFSADAGEAQSDGEEVRIYDRSDRFIGLYQYEAGRRQYRPEILLLGRE